MEPKNISWDDPYWDEIDDGNLSEDRNHDNFINDDRPDDLSGKSSNATGEIDYQADNLMNLDISRSPDAFNDDHRMRKPAIEIYDVANVRGKWSKPTRNDNSPRTGNVNPNNYNDRNKPYIPEITRSNLSQNKRPNKKYTNNNNYNINNNYYNNNNNERIINEDYMKFQKSRYNNKGDDLEYYRSDNYDKKGYHQYNVNSKIRGENEQYNSIEHGFTKNVGKFQRNYNQNSRENQSKVYENYQDNRQYSRSAHENLRIDNFRRNSPNSNSLKTRNSGTTVSRGFLSDKPVVGEEIINNTDRVYYNSRSYRNNRSQKY